ncbi:putative sporulation protein (polysaccharide deacetylase family) [Paenibacillus cellulosilyticus]|uniref:Putative sporulation protein (Polysaccharide deacetylase family) n=1 Tax=Paenibacillus cellulosilyticus TaxID=375489 RepID=A0A2V2YXG8_9BACL|nr:polysaccharide deacetylase family protein [Paenibacillus cellulosilyticus]PWW06447.1 putative sporulation protein (polysaccharide deacetylase family) [Paenibacillus cellulosilyticus]QKS46208.1 polysaccharide deacetylase family protein [Paenibacillus cellulosilyticus]
MKVGKVAAMAGCVLAILALVKLNEPFSEYIQAMRSTGSQVETSSPAYSDHTNERLLQEIRNEAAQRNIKPIDAKLDRVWKAIPGYNGLEVDVDRTYAANVSNDAGAPLKLFYKETAPAVNLNDLGAQPVYRGNPNKQMVSLMINVAWGNEFLEPMLKTLEEENVKATFFLDGTWLRNNPDLAKKILAGGHELSNHAYNHPNMSTLSRDAQYQQIAKTEALLESVLGVKDNRWFAPPSGDYNGTTVSIAHSQGLRTVLWTIDTIDWRKPPASTILSRVRNKLQPGALILMHPTASTRDALPDLIKMIKSKGYQLGTVSDTLSPKRTDAGG